MEIDDARDYKSAAIQVSLIGNRVKLGDIARYVPLGDN